MPVVCYHEFGGPPEFAGGPQYDVHGLNIEVSEFRKQLETMESLGYFPVNMRELVENRMHVPKGKRPIVLTFDDGRPTQFRYLPNGKLDPNCAVGVLVDFHHRHPDWPMKGSFYIIAGSDDNGVPFDQEGHERKKLKALLDWGFELGNHTLTHPSFKHLTANQIRKEVAGGDSYLKSLFPTLKVSTLAMPYGDLPADPKLLPLLVKGSYRRHSYRNEAILLVSGGLSRLPGQAGFDPFHIPRVLPIRDQLEKTLLQSAPTAEKSTTLKQEASKH